MGLWFTFTQIKYLHVSLLAKIFVETFIEENISSLTNQNVEEINIIRKIVIRKEKLHYEKPIHLSTYR